MYSNTPKISVIIPVYNVESYIDRCIKSVLEQTYKNLEIILVDDGSTDNCPAICDLWAAKDKRIKVIHQINQGVSCARNTAIKFSEGEYIGFVDSDDWIEPGMFKTMLKACIDNNTLMSVCGRYDIIESNDQRTVGKTPLENRVVEVEEALCCMLSGREMDCVVWDKLFHRSLWDDISFPEGKIFEDIAIMYLLVVKAKKIALCSQSYYNYFHRSGSIALSKFSMSLVDYPEHTRKIVDFVSCNYPCCIDAALCAHVMALGTLLKKINKSKTCENNNNCKKIFIQHCKELKKYRRYFLKCNHISKKEKFNLYVLSSVFLSHTYRFLYKLGYALDHE